MILAQPIETKQEVWLRGVDLNHRPLGYEPNELPDCSTPLKDDINAKEGRQTAALTVVRSKKMHHYLSTQIDRDAAL